MTAFPAFPRGPALFLVCSNSALAFFSGSFDISHLTSWTELFDLPSMTNSSLSFPGCILAISCDDVDSRRSKYECSH